jgi:glucuronokinase
MAAPEFVARASAPARVALAGNPSDGYGGAVLAVTIEDFCAHVEVRAGSGGPAGVRPDSELVAAAVERFADELDQRARHATIRWRTSIPRSVGLGGSSALVIATLQALSVVYWTPIEPDRLAELALAVETEDLGIAAGLQDRVAQAYAGLTFMEFGGERGRYEQLGTELLPPLVVAWRADAGEDSRVVHSDLRERYERADPIVRASMAELAAAAREARDALLSGDHAGLGRCLDASFDARARLLELDPRHVQMVRAAREYGASANYAGSGGAIVCACRNHSHQTEVIAQLRSAGCSAIAPTVGAGQPTRTV